MSFSSARPVFLAGLAILLTACDRPAPPDSLAPGGYRFELFTRATPQAEPELAVAGVFFLSGQPFADPAMLARREALAHIAPLDEVERHLLKSGVSNFCFAARPTDTLLETASAAPVPLAFSVARRNAQMIEVLMYNGADWSYSWTLGTQGDGSIGGRWGERMWELYEDEIRVMHDESVTVESCFELPLTM